MVLLERRRHDGLAPGDDPASIGRQVTSAPAIVHSARSTEVVAAQDGGLDFLWNTDGAPGWNSSRITVPGAWLSGTPAVARTGSGTEITARAAGGSLWFFWNANGIPGWHPRELGGRAERRVERRVGARYQALIAPLVNPTTADQPGARPYICRGGHWLDEAPRPTANGASSDQSHPTG